MSSPSAEALDLVRLSANSERYEARLRELISKTEAADKATLALQAAQKAAEQSSAAKLQVADALLQSLTDQSDGIQAANAEAAAKLAAREKEVAEREAAVTEREKKNADEVARALRDHERRSAELEQQRSTQDEDFHRRVEDLRGVENKLRDHHSGLRDIVSQARQGLASAS